MKIYDLDSEFVRRLENWGMYFGGNTAKQYVSPTHEVCKRLAAEHGKQLVVGYAESVPRLEIDSEDAKVIEWCWAMSGHRLHPQDRALIKAHYVSRADPRTVCRVLKIKFYTWESSLCEAVIEFQNVVDVLEGCKDLEHIG